MNKSRGLEIKERLVNTAKALSQELGDFTWSLSDVATRANHPLGNLYYHFKTKASLINKVVDGVDTGNMDQMSEQQLAELKLQVSSAMFKKANKL